MPAPLIAVIPARGGSKRVPRKNIRLLNGRPAIHYTITAAIESGLFERVIVSTDSREIADISVAGGAECPFLRDAALADDFTPVSEVTIDAIARVDPDMRYGAVCQLMANCPLRTSGDVRDAYRQFVATDAPAQISVTDYGWLNPWWAVRMDDTFRLEHLLPDSLGRRSQDLPPVYCPTGAVWWAQSAVLRQAGTFHAPGKRGWRIPWHRAVDIDSEDDWKLAELLVGTPTQK